MIDFYFKDKVDKLFKNRLKYTADHNLPVGFAVKNCGFGFVCLASPVFKICNAVSEDLMIQTVCETISHETIHLCLDDIDFKYIEKEDDLLEEICELG
jgi:hypothetical protein